MNPHLSSAGRLMGVLLAAAIIASWPADSSGQPPVAPAPAPSAATYYPYSTYASGYDHASTYSEGVARGMADVVRSAGAAELMASEAAKNYEQARAMYFNNRLKYTQTYFEMKQLNEQYREERRGQRPTSEQLFRIAEERAPEPLSPSELDPYSGEISWPPLLLAPEYTDLRETSERLIHARVSDAVSMSVDERQALSATLGALATKLKSNISAYDPEDYVAAKNFLQSLAATTGAGMIE
ncbi:MAG: hypothetical protein KY475_08505 [Planctomycetes bacterium]|nr:hypothetical protein [Planctomycetota bacterium]